MSGVSSGSTRGEIGLGRCPIGLPAYDLVRKNLMTKDVTAFSGVKSHAGVSRGQSREVTYCLRKRPRNATIFDRKNP